MSSGTEESSFVPKASLTALLSELGLATLGTCLVLVLCRNFLLDLWELPPLL